MACGYFLLAGALLIQSTMPWKHCASARLSKVDLRIGARHSQVKMLPSWVLAALTGRHPGDHSGDNHAQSIQAFMLQMCVAGSLGDLSACSNCSARVDMTSV